MLLVKRSSWTLVLAFLISFFFVKPAFAKNDSQDIPEVDGTYDVAGHPNLKVRVFVYRAKPTPSPVLACTDNPSSSVDGPTGWHLPQSWSYKLNLSSVPTNSINLPTISASGLGVWSNAISGKVLFVYGGPTNILRQSLDGQNIIAWGRTQGSALAVTYTWYDTGTHQATETDTIMNSKFKWGWSQNQCLSGVYDAQDILTHELGHWMGLSDHYTSNYSENTMYGYGTTGEIKKDTLTDGDVNGVKAIYP